MNGDNRDKSRSRSGAKDAYQGTEPVSMDESDSLLDSGSTIVLDDGSIYAKLSLDDFAQQAIDEVKSVDPSSTIMLDDGSIYTKLNHDEFARQSTDDVRRVDPSSTIVLDDGSIDAKSTLEEFVSQSESESELDHPEPNPVNRKVQSR